MRSLMLLLSPLRQRNGRSKSDDAQRSKESCHVILWLTDSAFCALSLYNARCVRTVHSRSVRMTKNS